MRTLIRRIWNVFAILGMAVTLYFLLLIVLIYLQARHDELRPADAIVVLGTAQYNGKPSPVLSARLDHAADLYHRGIAPIIITTGGHGPDPLYTEAGVGKVYLIEQGIPESAILTEERGETSWESMVEVQRLADAHQIRRIVLVSDPFHVLRLKLMARHLGLEAVGSPTRTSPISDQPLVEFAYVVREALGITHHEMQQLLLSLTTWSPKAPSADFSHQ